MGWDNQALRYLGLGSYTGICFTRSIRESVFMDKILRDTRKFDLDVDEAAAALYESKHHKRALTKEDKNAAMDLLSASVADHIKSFAGHNEAAQRIRELEVQLAESKSPNASSSSSSKSSEAKTSLPVLETKKGEKRAREEDESVHPILDVDTTTKVLRTNCPANGTTAKVTEWIKKMKIPAEKRKVIEASIVEFNEFYDKLAGHHKLMLPDVLAAYGCPTRIAGVMKDRDIVRVIAVAVTIVNLS